MTKHIFTMLAVLLLASPAVATTYYTRSTGTWTGAIWGTTTTGAGSTLPALNDGDVLYIDDAININSIITINKNITIYVNALLTIDGQLNVGAGSIFNFPSSSGQITSTPPGNSDKIFIGTGPAEWTGNDGTITGPGTFGNGWNCCVLPVELISLQAISYSAGIRLEWATASELNFDQFAIERSTDGFLFETVGYVKGQGFSQVRVDYIFQDTHALIGRNYYRLRSIDIDGSFTISKTVTATYAGAHQAQLYPVPCDGQTISILLNYIPASGGHVEVFNQTGIKVQEMAILNQLTTLVFTPVLKPGNYILRFSSPELQRMIRFTVH